MKNPTVNQIYRHKTIGFACIVTHVEEGIVTYYSMLGYPKLKKGRIPMQRRVADFNEDYKLDTLK